MVSYDIIEIGNKGEVSIIHTIKQFQQNLIDAFSKKLFRKIDSEESMKIRDCNIFSITWIDSESYHFTKTYCIKLNRDVRKECYL